MYSIPCLTVSSAQSLVVMSLSYSTVQYTLYVRVQYTLSYLLLNLLLSCPYHRIRISQKQRLRSSLLVGRRTWMPHRMIWRNVLERKSSLGGWYFIVVWTGWSFVQSIHSAKYPFFSSSWRRPLLLLLWDSYYLVLYTKTRSWHGPDVVLPDPPDCLSLVW